MKLLFDALHISTPSQVYNLDEIGLSPGSDDLVRMRGQIVGSEMGKRAVIPRPNFKYHHRITVLVRVFADGSPTAPAVMCRDEREPMLISETKSKRESEVVFPLWSVSWRKDLASVDTIIFQRWIDKFIYVVRHKVDEEMWIVLFFEALRAHMSPYVIEKTSKNQIAVMELPAYSSDRLQNLDVVVFG